MPKILASDGMDKSAIEKLQSLGYEVDVQFYEPDALGDALADYDVLVVRSATKVRQPIIDKAVAHGKLKLVIRGGVGVDNIDVAYGREKGLIVTNTPAASSNSVAELAIGHMFSIARYIGIANATMRNGEWNKKAYEGTELAGKTLGLIGFGRIGRLVAAKANALGMNVLYTDIIGPAKDEVPCEFCDVARILSDADYISLHVPMADKPILGKDEIAQLKDGVFLVNTSRGGLIDEDALIEALDSGKVGGAALDVFSEEPCKNEKILSHPKISLTPHIGAATKEAQQRIGAEIVSIICENVPV
ncbi:D-2-hydroxyacid dehydrogenase [Ruminococcaceae bacterium OttesenSCG-928-A11]|nr:D-2-hydroxyacid dehydrogenase [Ruminococcaceae bacterium OttesenSCG-928-A11]